MKILHVIPGLTRERGGTSAVVDALVRHQAEAGHQLGVLTTNQGARNGEQFLQPPWQARLECLTVRGPDRYAYVPGLGRTVRNLLGQYDLVHLHSIFTYPVHVVLREAHRLGTRLVFTPHGMLCPYSLGISRWKKRVYLGIWGQMIRRACTAWHYTSEQEAAESWPYDGSRQFIVPNGIDPCELAVDRAEARRRVAERWPELRDRPLVLFLGRLHPKKRLDLLVSAFLAGAPADARLVVAGPDEARLWSTIADRWLADPEVAGRVVRLGTVQGTEKTDLLAAARVFALPSEHENFGIAALEALAAGTAVLLSPGVDLSREVAQAGWGEPLPIHFETWRDRLGEMLFSAEDDRHEERRRWATEHFSWSAITSVLIEHYRQITAIPTCSLNGGC